MAYPSDGDPIKFQLLEAIQTNLEAVATPSYHFDFQEVKIFDSGKIVLGGPMPFVAIIPEDDTQLRELSCTVIERQALITLIGAIRIDFRDPLWKKELHWLVSDIKVALSLDPKLSDTCTYHEFVSEDAYEVADQSIALATLDLRVVYRHLSDNPTLAVSP